MNEKVAFWKRRWDSRSKEMSSDYEIDRGISFRGEEIEQLSEKDLLDFINPKASDYIFDAGCGTGINLSRLNSRVKAIIGMDYSQGMINRSKNRISRETIPNATLMVGTISDIGLKSNMFDKMVCMSVLQYMNDEECKAALKEFVRICKDNGIVVLHIKNLSSLYLSTLYLAKKVKSLFTKNVEIPYYRSYKWYEERLSELGARIMDYNSVNIFLIDILPEFLCYELRKIERKYYRVKFFRKHGADYNIKAQIKKAK